MSTDQRRKCRLNHRCHRCSMNFHYHLNNNTNHYCLNNDRMSPLRNSFHLEYCNDYLVNLYHCYYYYDLTLWIMLLKVLFKLNWDKKVYRIFVFCLCIQLDYFHFCLSCFSCVQFCQARIHIFSTYSILYIKI